MRSRHTISLAMVCIVLAGCADPYRFGLHRNSGWPVEGWIQGDYRNVDASEDHILKLGSSARASIRVKKLTDGVFYSDLLLGPGSQVTFRTRTTPYDRDAGRDDGITITIGPDRTSVTSNGTMKTVATPIPSDTLARLEIVNDGQWTDVTVACVHVGRFPSKHPSTEWILVDTDATSHCTLVNPRFDIKNND